VVQKAFNKEQWQSSSVIGAGAALIANGRPSSPSYARDFCTYYKKPYHTEAKCFLKHPHLKKEFNGKRRAKSKRKSDSIGELFSKKLNKSSTKSTPSLTPSVEPIETSAVMIHNF